MVSPATALFTADCIDANGAVDVPAPLLEPVGETYIIAAKEEPTKPERTAKREILVHSIWKRSDRF